MNGASLLGVFSLLLGAILFLGTEQVNAQSASLEWEGSIDDRANLVIRGNRVRVQTLSGQRNGNGRTNWEGGQWNNRPRGRVDVDKLDGRGRVRVIQQPSRRNNFTTIVQIYDDKGGRDRYRLRVQWD